MSSAREAHNRVGCGANRIGRLVVALALALDACGGVPLASATPTVAGSAAATSSPAQTTQSSPTPAAPAGVLSELRWSQPGLIPDAGTISAVAPWRGGFIGVGQVNDNGRYVGAAFASADGATWSRTSTATTFAAIPDRLVATNAELIALASSPASGSALAAWTSTDGRSWQGSSQLTLPGASVSALGSYQGLAIAAGTDAAGQPRLWRSDGGAPWVAAPPPSLSAIILQLVPLAEGIVALGRDGDPDRASGGVRISGVGRPAAWRSADGRAWNALQVEGTPAAGAELVGLFELQDGLLAVGSDAPDPAQSARTALFWTSSDGRNLQKLGPASPWGVAGANGRLAVVFANPISPTARVDVWASRDGRRWTLLTFSGDLADIPGLTVSAGQTARIDLVLVTSRGVVIVGQRDGRGATWFAEGVLH